MAMVNQLIQQKPDWAELYALKASIYYSKWVYAKIQHLPKKADADICIAWYQKYLDRAPANDPWRKEAEDTIQFVRDT